MSTKVMQYKDGDTTVLEFPELEFVSNNDPDIHKILLDRKLAVGIVGAVIITENVRLVAGKNNNDDFSFNLYEGGSS